MMGWLKVVLTGLFVALAVNSEVKADEEEQQLTWAEIVGGRLPEPLGPFPNDVVNEQNVRYSEHQVEKNSDDYDYEYTDYDDEFFKNPDYIYVDTEDDNYIRPEAQVEESGVSQTADRRTLDFFYHLLSDQFRTDRGDDGRPVRDATTRRPSLIEAVFRTIDNHIVEDLQEWSTYTAQRDAQVANTEAPPPATNLGVAASVQPIGPDSNIVLVTDEQGHQHVVTINDIVSSLAHLDERTLTNLLLSDPAHVNDRSSEVLLNPSPNVAFAEIPAASQHAPVVLGAQKKGQVGVVRPARHTGPVVTSDEEEEEEVYIVQDENGQVQLVTLENILSSLAQLDDDSINELLFQNSNFPTLVSPSTSDTAPVVANTPTPTEELSAISPAVTSGNKSSDEPDKPKKPSPSVSTDFDGNIRVLAHPGSVIVDLKDLSWQAEELEETEPEEIEPENPAPLFISGSLVEKDEEGNIFITPDPEKPFTLDIQNIISIAEQADTPEQNSKATPSKSTKNLIQEEDKESEEEVERGHELLSYLAGVENFLPTAILPDPIHSSVPISAAVQNEAAQTEVNAFRSSLLQAISQQRAVVQPTTPQPVVQPLIQRLVQPVVQPIVQPIVQAVTQTSQQASSGGIGATLSQLLSNLVGQSPTQQPVPVSVPQPEDKLPEQEFIKLVVRQQAPNSVDTHFGDVTIPLPQAIHYQPTSKPTQATTAETTQISSRVDVPSPLTGLPLAIQKNLRLQANNVPKFIPPGARSVTATQRSLTPAASRSDFGPVLRTDDKITDTDAVNPTSRSDAKPIIRIPVRNPSLPRIAPRKAAPSRRPLVNPAQPRIPLRNPAPPRIPLVKSAPPRTPPVTKKPVLSLSSVLAGLPPKVVESLRKQLNNARLGSSLEEETELPVEKQESEITPDVQLDRSSYASLPAYESTGGGGYGYGSSGTGTKSNPLLDIYLLADLTKVHKIGDTNLSVKSPIIGDPSYFVKTNHPHGYRR